MTEAATVIPAPNRTWYVAWALIAVAAAFAVVAGGGSAAAGTQFTAYRVVSLSLMLAALAAWLVAATLREAWRPRSALDLGFAAVLVALLVALGGSRQPRIGLDYVAYSVLLAGGYLLLVRLFAHRFFEPRLGSLAVLLSIVTSVSYLGTVVVQWIHFWSQIGRLEVPPLRPYGEGIWWGNPIPVAAASLLLATAALGHLGLATRRARATSALVVGLALVTVFVTGARGGWVALLGSGILVGIASMFRPEHRQAARALAGSRRVRLSAAAVVVTGIGLGVLLWPSIGLRLEAPATDRLAFNSASLAMFADHPVTGVGPGMWTVDRIQFTQPPDVDEYVPQAHNLVLQTVAELGLVGAVAGLIVVAVVLRLVRRGLRSDDPLTRRLGWATLFGGLFVLIQQLTVVYTDAAGLWFCYALAVARLDARLTDDRPVSRRAFGPVALGLALVFGAAGAWLAHSEQAALANDAAVSAANGDDWPGALAAARTAAELDPAMPPYQFGLGLAEAHAGDRAAAVDHLRASAEIDDYPVAWLDVARLELDLGRPDEARAALGRAMRLGYQQPQVAVGASQLELELGDRSAAVAALADALLVAPSLASDPFWIDPVRGPVLADALTAALATATPETGYRLALEGGRPADAAAFVAAMPPAEQAVPALVVRAWAGDLAAFEELHARAVADPLNVDTVLQCRRITNRSTEDQTVDPRWACDGAGSPGIPLLVRIVPERSTLMPLPGVADPTAHFADVYRRNGPFNQLVPGLWQLQTMAI